MAPQVHEFVLQGIQTLYLVYRPLFHHANGRHQLILQADFANPADKEAYKNLRQKNSSAQIWQLRTHEATTIEQILSEQFIVGDIASDR